MSNRAGNLALGAPKFPTISPRGRWADQAACIGTDPDLWFLEDEGSYRDACQICAVCPVRQECLDWAVETNTQHGLFGGLSPHQRKKLRRGHSR